MAIESKVLRLRTVETVHGFEDNPAGQAMAAELKEAGNQNKYCTKDETRR